MPEQKFSIAKRANSFRFAFAGVSKFLSTEHNAWIHLAATLAVATAGLLLHISVVEGSILALAVGFVWVTEILNTCVEKIMDFISPERDSRVAWIKDMAAAAVLMASIAAVVAGALIFIPKLL